MHKRFGFDMRRYSMPACGEMRHMLKKSGFRILKYRDNGCFFVKSVKNAMPRKAP
jgi:hypothetical protein